MQELLNSPSLDLLEQDGCPNLRIFDFSYIEYDKSKELNLGNSSPFWTEMERAINWDFARLRIEEIKAEEFLLDQLSVC